MQATTREDNASFDAAEDFVCEALQRETHEQSTSSGDEIDVDNMQHCDCVPVIVDGERFGVGKWDLVAVKPTRRGLSATYKSR